MVEKFPEETIAAGGGHVGAAKLAVQEDDKVEDVHWKVHTGMEGRYPSVQWVIEKGDDGNKEQLLGDSETVETVAVEDGHRGAVVVMLIKEMGVEMSTHRGRWWGKIF